MYYVVLMTVVRPAQRFESTWDGPGGTVCFMVGILNPDRWQYRASRVRSASN